MARKAPKMTNLEIEETSGVDHPAHLHEGWLVVKASNASTVADVLRTLPEPMEESMSEATDLIVESEPVLNAEGEEQKMEGDMEAKAVEEELAMAMARITELEARLAEVEGMAEMEMPEEDKAMHDEEEKVAALAKAAPAPLRKAMEELAKAAADAKAELVKEREDRADSEAIIKAKETFKHLNLDPAKVGPALRRLSVTDESLAKSIEDALLSADAQNESANIFSEVGKGFAPSGDAFEKMTSLAKAAVSEGKAASIEQAMAHVAVSNPALYNDYLIEKGA